MPVPIEIDVWQGEIAELEVDAIIVPANESLFMTNPLAQSVKRRAGETVEREAVAQSPVAPGSAVVTGGGNLAASHIIHAVAVGHELKQDREVLASALNTAFDHGGAPWPDAHRDDADWRGARRLQRRGGGRCAGGGAGGSGSTR